jgi:hypothetical protein
MPTSASGPYATSVRSRRRPLTWQDIRGDTRRRADELLCTDAEAAALQALRVATVSGLRCRLQAGEGEGAVEV